MGSFQTPTVFGLSLIRKNEKGLNRNTAKYNTIFAFLVETGLGPLNRRWPFAMWTPQLKIYWLSSQAKKALFFNSERNKQKFVASEASG